MTPLAWTISLVGGALPFCIFVPMHWWGLALVPLITSFAMIAWMKHRLNGYTGDCCGATFLVSELTFYLSVQVVFLHLW
jgi:adenosylcobinamide-GDP ribazoletransferase